MLNLKTINKNIRLIKNAGVKLDERIHVTGVSIMHHASEHGDFTAMQRLYDALAQSARRKAFVKWVVDHTPLNFEEKTQYFVKSRKTTKVYNVKSANDQPFWIYTNEVKPALDLDKLLQLPTIIEQSEKRIANATENGVKIKGSLKEYKERVKRLQNLAA